MPQFGKSTLWTLTSPCISSCHQCVFFSWQMGRECCKAQKKISFAVLCLWQIYLRSRSPFAFVITEIAPLQEDIRCTKYVVGFYIYRWSKMYGCNTFRNNHILRHYNKNIFVVLLNWIQSLAAALATRKVAFIHLTKAAQFVFGERNVLVRAHAV